MTTPTHETAIRDEAPEHTSRMRSSTLTLRVLTANCTTDRPLNLGALAVIGVAFLVICFAQSPGLIEFDTRLPMLISPITFFGSVLHLWNQSVFGGTVEAGSAFLVPQGLFFIVGYVLHDPVWVTERFWLATLLTVGCWGVIRLAESLGIGNRLSRVMAGIAYCAAPIVVTWVTTTADLLAVVLLPWVLRPLVIGSREGSTRRAAARSGVAVALIGGSNAAVLLAVLPIAIIWLLTREHGPRRRSLTTWWIVAVAMAAFFWMVSLVFVQQLGYNYLPYTETSITTTSTASVFESLRGASYWTDYYSLGGALIRGDWMLVSVSILIVGTAVTAALGLAGLCRRLPERLFLVSSLTFGVVVISAGYSGPLGGVFSPAVQHVLQGSLAPFRNIGKFSPDVALPLAMGLAWTLSIPWRGEGHRATKKAPGRIGLRMAITLFGAAAIFLAAAPYWRGELYPTGGFAGIPSYWQQVGAFLNEHQGHENALLVPGSNFADYTWGNPNDEPLQVFASTSLEWRNIIPLGSNGYIQMLDAVEQALDNGSSPAGLATYLSREGINYVVERNDLNLEATGAPPPAQVHQVLMETPGLSEVASFGPYLPAAQVAIGLLPVYDSTSYERLRAVNVFRVNQTTSPVQAYPASDPVVISGDVGSIVPLAGAGILSDRVSVLSGDPASPGLTASPGATWAITDGNQRRVTSFGNIRDNQSYLLGPTQSLPGVEAGVPYSFSVAPGVQHETVSAPVGAVAVSASSFASSLLEDTPSQGPASAFDDDLNTAWVANATDGSVGQWVSITFDKPIRISGITVTPWADGLDIRRLEISTDKGTVSRQLTSGGQSYYLSVVPGYTRHLKVTIAATRSPSRPPGGSVLGAGISEISIPGVKFQPRMMLPDDNAAPFAGRPDAVVVSLNRPIANTNFSLGLSSTDDTAMSREFNLPSAESVSASGYAVPQLGSTLNSLIEVLDPVPASSLHVSASSTLGGLPRFSAYNLVDDSGMPWIAQVGDGVPSIRLSWQGNRTVTSISLRPSPVAARPTEVSITPAGGRPTIEKVPPRGGVIRFPAAVTDSLLVSFVAVKKQDMVAPNLVTGLTLPVGLSSVGVPGLITSPVPRPKMDKTFALACGTNPAVQIDGKVMMTSVTGTIGDLIDLKPVHVTLCTPPGGLRLQAGNHNFESPNLFESMEVTSFLVKPSQMADTTYRSHRSVSVESWTAESRTFRVGAGAATYLVVAQNYNPGWVAVLGDETLKSIRVDGWEQGYLVPAGKAGTVTVSMRDNGLYEILLALGLVLLVGLIVLALKRGRPVPFDAARPRALPNFWLLLALSAAALVVIAGPLAIALIPLVVVARRWGPGPLSLIAFVAFVVAGAFAASHPPSLFTTGAAAFGGPAQLASVIAFGAVLGSLVADSWAGGLPAGEVPSNE